MSSFHIDSIKKRFPRAYKSFREEGYNDTWEDLSKWIKSKGIETRYYALGMKKIENSLK